jgi:hypothetical protein
LTTADMLSDRTLAASRSHRATGAAIRAAIFTQASTCTLHAGRRRREMTVPPWRLYTDYTVMQIITFGLPLARSRGGT